MGKKADKIQAELDRANEELAELRRYNAGMRARADQLETENNDLRMAGRCLFTALTGEGGPSPTEGIGAWLADRMQTLEHAQAHWLEVDPR